MQVELLHHTPLNVCSTAIRMCYDTHSKSDSENDKSYEKAGTKDRDLIRRIGVKMKHNSVLNHLQYTFRITGISTKTLLALTRHDIGTEFTVQSTRFTVHKGGSYTQTKDESINKDLKVIELIVNKAIKRKCKNDDIAMLLPQAYQYNLVMTASLNAIKHLLKLRLDGKAHYDIRAMAKLMQDEIPVDHQYLLIDEKTYIEDDESQELISAGDRLFFNGYDPRYNTYSNKGLVPELDKISL